MYANNCSGLADIMPKIYYAVDHDETIYTQDDVQSTRYGKIYLKPQYNGNPINYPRGPKSLSTYEDGNKYEPFYHAGGIPIYPKHLRVDDILPYLTYDIIVTSDRYANALLQTCPYPLAISRIYTNIPVYESADSTKVVGTLGFKQYYTMDLCYYPKLIDDYQKGKSPVPPSLFDIKKRIELAMMGKLYTNNTDSRTISDCLDYMKEYYIYCTQGR